MFGFIGIRFGSCEARRLTLGVTNKLFDSLFLAILQYGSEVWGIYDKENFNTWEKDDIEKTHMYFCKQFLVVNKQCANVATRYELGRLPIKLGIEKIQGVPENNIARQCLQLSKEMADKNQTGLMQKIDQLYVKYNSSCITLNENNKKLSTSHIKEKNQKRVNSPSVKIN